MALQSATLHSILGNRNRGKTKYLGSRSNLLITHMQQHFQYLFIVHNFYYQNWSGPNIHKIYFLPPIIAGKQGEKTKGKMFPQKYNLYIEITHRIIHTEELF